MKKIIAVIATLTLLFTLGACSSGAPKSDNGHVADKYANLMENDDSTYYYEAKLTEELFDEETDEEPVESIMAEARGGKGKLAILSGEEKEFDTRWVRGSGNVDYTIYDEDKEYSEAEKEDEENVAFEYVKTSEIELDGKTYQCDVYQNEFQMEGYSEDGEEANLETYVYIKRYLVDDDGQLYAIMYNNEQKGKEGEENQMIHQRIERITKFEENKVPDGVFDIPKDYKKVDSDEM